jgi:hypothetical protein
VWYGWAEPTGTLELSIPQRLALYLDDLVLLQGFGGSRQEIIRNFVWKEVNRLIEAERLDQRLGEPRRDYTV